MKVLDFGLAKALDPASGASGDAMSSPSPGVLATAANVILGTAAYMSPEQARGRPIDRRADIWAFGVVLFEMLAGQRPFTGETNSDTLASVLKTDPNWRALPSDTPLPVRRLLRRCLEKDRRRRLDSAAAARLEIDDAIAPPAAETLPRTVPRSARVTAVAIAALAGGAVIALAAWASWTLLRPSLRAPGLPSRFAIVPPPEPALNVSGPNRDLAFSPDGRRFVYHVGGTETNGSPLMIRAIDQLEAQPVSDVRTAYAPFFSPDSRWIGFFEERVLKKVSIAGGPIISLCQLSGVPLGATWGDDNTIAFATNSPSTGLWRVSADGGEPAVLTTPDPAQHERNHAFPSMLPGGRGVLFTIAIVTAGQADSSQVAVLDLKTGRQKILIRGGGDAQYSRDRAPDFCAGWHAARRAVRSGPARSAERSGNGRRTRAHEADRRSQLRPLAVRHAHLHAGGRRRADDAALARLGRSERARGTDQGAAARLRTAADFARRHPPRRRHPRPGEHRDLDLGSREGNAEAIDLRVRNEWTASLDTRRPADRFHVGSHRHAEPVQPGRGRDRHRRPADDESRTPNGPRRLHRTEPACSASTPSQSEPAASSRFR